MKRWNGWEDENTAYPIPDIAKEYLINLLGEFQVLREGTKWLRLGNLLPGGGFTVMHRIKDIVLKELKWDEHRWEEELTQYRQLLKQSYSVKL